VEVKEGKRERDGREVFRSVGVGKIRPTDTLCGSASGRGRKKDKCEVRNNTTSSNCRGSSYVADPKIEKKTRLFAVFKTSLHIITPSIQFLHLRLSNNLVLAFIYLKLHKMLTDLYWITVQVSMVTCWPRSLIVFTLTKTMHLQFRY